MVPMCYKMMGGYVLWTYRAFEDLVWIHKMWWGLFVELVCAELGAACLAAPLNIMLPLFWMVGLFVKFLMVRHRLLLFWLNLQKWTVLTEINSWRARKSQRRAWRRCWCRKIGLSGNSCQLSKFAVSRLFVALNNGCESSVEIGIASEYCQSMVMSWTILTMDNTILCYSYAVARKIMSMYLLSFEEDLNTTECNLRTVGCWAKAKTNHEKYRCEPFSSFVRGWKFI